MCNDQELKYYLLSFFESLIINQDCLFQGLDFVHKSSIHYHGNLKSSNCVVDSRWTCKLADFGVPSLRYCDKSHKEDENPDSE